LVDQVLSVMQQGKGEGEGKVEVGEVGDEGEASRVKEGEVV